MTTIRRNNSDQYGKQNSRWRALGLKKRRARKHGVYQPRKRCTKKLKFKRDELEPPSFANVGHKARIIWERMKDEPRCRDIANGRWCDAKDAESYGLEAGDWLAMEVGSSEAQAVDLDDDDVKAIGQELKKMQLGRKR